MEKTLTLIVKPMGQDGLWALRNQLNEFVLTHFELLYQGAIRLGCHIPRDYYAPRRVQLRDTRLHERTGLKIAHGHRYDDEPAPSEEQLRQTIKDIQTLIDKASENIPSPFTLRVEERE